MFVAIPVQRVLGDLRIFFLLVSRHWTVLILTKPLLCQVAERACKAVLANAPPLEAFVLLARPEQMGTVAVALDVSAAHASTRG